MCGLSYFGRLGSCYPVAFVGTGESRPGRRGYYRDACKLWRRGADPHPYGRQ